MARAKIEGSMGDREHSVEGVVDVLRGLLTAVLALLGLLFLVAAGQGNAVVRVIIGLICWAAAAAIFALARLRPQHVTYRQQLDLSGDVQLEQLNCRQCGAALSREAVRVEAGAVFVHCDYCGAHYQLEEAPKW